MHPHQTSPLTGMSPLLTLLPTLARTGLARLVVDPKDGPPVEQARQFARDVARMPAEQNEAARLTTLGDRPLAVVTAGTGSQPGWCAKQDDLAALSTNSAHRIVRGSTHQSLIDDHADAAQSGRAVRDVVRAVRLAAPMGAVEQRPGKRGASP